MLVQKKERTERRKERNGEKENATSFDSDARSTSSCVDANTFSSWAWRLSIYDNNKVASARVITRLHSPSRLTLLVCSSSVSRAISFCCLAFCCSNERTRKVSSSIADNASKQEVRKHNHQEKSKIKKSDRNQTFLSCHDTRGAYIIVV